jgi:hypothetical protein
MKSLMIALGSIVAVTAATASAQAQTPASPARVFTPAPVAVLTQRYDNGRTAANLNEHILNVSSVESGQFQKLYTIVVAGQVYAQPLLVPHVGFADGTYKTVLIVATMTNEVYAFEVSDAIYGGPSSPILLWNTHVGTPVAGDLMPMSSSVYRCVGKLMCIPTNPRPTSSPWALPPVGLSPRDVVNGGYGSYNINPSIGIVSTPVVDADLGRIFLVSKQKANTTYATASGQCDVSAANDKALLENRLISLDLKTGAILRCVDLGVDPKSWKDGFASDRDPVTHKIRLNNRNQMQRPALLLQNHEIYAGLASHQDTPPWHGWIFAYDEDLQFKNDWISTPNAMGGGVWQSGSGLAGDSQGHVYAMTGNGERDGPLGHGKKWLDLSTWPLLHNYAGMFVQLSPDLRMLHSYSTDDELYREVFDEDVGSSGPVLIPETPFVLGGDKEAKFFVLNTSPELSKQQYFQAGLEGCQQRHTGDDSAERRKASQGSIGCLAPLQNHHIHGAPALWRSETMGLMAYVWPERDNLLAFRWDETTQRFDMPPAQESAMTSTPCYPCMPGGMVSISADGNKSRTGILWASTTDPTLTNSLYSFPATPGVTNVSPGVLYAFDAESLSQPIWSSGTNPQRDGTGFFAKFNLPVVADGRVYLATFSNEVDIFGLKEWAKYLEIHLSQDAVTAGSSLTASVTFLNAGTTTWTTGSYGVASTNATSGIAPLRYELLADAPPGTEVTIAVPVTAPKTPGTYSLQLQMVDSESQWFGEETDVIKYTVQ